MAYISSREIGNVALRPARLEVGHYDSLSDKITGLHTFSTESYMQMRSAFDGH